MEGILVVAHGSRRKETEDFFREMVCRAAELSGREMVESAFMEFSETTIDKGLAVLAGRGATQIKVVPYFLFEGMHIRRDIPGEIEKFSAQNPNVEVIMDSIFGRDQRLTGILADRMGR